MTAASKLEGLALNGGWKVIKRLSQQPSSGGQFSVQYIVKGQDGNAYFLKAFDFSAAFESGIDTVTALRKLTSSFEHERDILEHCRERRLSRVVLAIDHGYVQVPGMSQIEGQVYYLIFELADRDVRCQVDAGNRLDTMWCLRALDDIALGLWQIHRSMIAHQDLKPSNVLIYSDKICRVADLGRSSRRGHPIWYDEFKIAGDQTYAPPELLYGFAHPDFMARRLGCDLYLFGNLLSFMFSGVNVTSALLARIDEQLHPRKWGGPYEQVLPYLMGVFSDLVKDITNQVDPLVRHDVQMMVRELCTPDLSRRGHPKSLNGFGQYSLERYKSRMDLLVKRTAVQVRVKNST